MIFHQQMFCHAQIEAYDQLLHRTGDRQVNGARRALVYGNGGVFSASAVAILEIME
eukprot:SAG31_NODE_199_length_20573_cov_5.832129_10_plen_56_part_00